MKPFFSPSTIAVVGASSKPEKIGHQVLVRLSKGFEGRVYPIHSREPAIAGFRTYADLSRVPEPIDLLVALVPAPNVIPLVESCRDGQVKFLLTVSAGFGEVSREGKDMERALVAQAARRGMRVVGPNCMGMMNAAIGLNASLVPDMPPGGTGFSCLTQSGGFGIAVSMYALDHQLPVANICDLGNTADVQVTEVLEHFRDDEATAVAGVFLESAPDFDAFATGLADLAARKPVIFTALGRSAAGARASRAHLGLEPNLEAVPPVLRSRGVYLARTGRELLNDAKALTWQPLSAGRRVAIMTGTGGIAAELTDLCIDHGLEVPAFSKSLQQDLFAHLPPYASARNPIDLTPIYNEYPRIYPALMTQIAESGEADMILVSITDVATGLAELAENIGRLDNPIPVIVFWGSRTNRLDNLRVLEGARVPCYTTTWEATRAAAALCGATRS